MKRWMEQAILLRSELTIHLGWLVTDTYKHLGMVVVLNNFDFAKGLELLVFTVPMTASEKNFSSCSLITLFLICFTSHKNTKHISKSFKSRILPLQKFYLPHWMWNFLPGVLLLPQITRFIIFLQQIFKDSINSYKNQKGKINKSGNTCLFQ